MFHKSLCTLLTLSMLASCTHQQIEKDHPTNLTTRLFQNTFKPKKHRTSGADKRLPATERSIPGLDLFVAALKSYPDSLKVPVGFEVVKEITRVSNGKIYKEQDKSVFLRQTFNNHFVLESYVTLGSPFNFHLYESQKIENIENDLRDDQSIVEFKKLSPTKFSMVLKMPGQFSGLCQMDIDLMKSTELAGFTCNDDSGRPIYESKVTSVKPIKTQDYLALLKSMKLQVHPIALDCGIMQTDNENGSKCFDSVTDSVKRDWSYLILE